jgi:hypothetical protein
MQPVSETLPKSQRATSQAGVFMTFVACVAGALVPGLGHALLRKWDRAIVFFGCIGIMMMLGIYLDGRLFNPDFEGIISTLKFVAEAGAGIFYWIPWLQGAGMGDPTAYTFDYANIFIYVAGLLNMLVIIDAFDIALGRKQ